MDVIIEDNIDYLKEVKEVLKGGHILCVYREMDRMLGDKVVGDLISEFRITKKILPSKVENTSEVLEDVMDTEDDVRLIVGIVNSVAGDIIKVASTMLGIPYVIVLASPHVVVDDTAYIIENNMVEERHITSPSKVLASMNYLGARGGYDELIANICSEMLYRIDTIYIDVASEKGISSQVYIDDILSNIADIGACDKKAMLRTAYKVGARYTIVRQLASMLSHSGANVVSVHNYEFALTYIILLLYQSYFKVAEVDLLYPPSIESSATVLSKVFGMEKEQCIMNYKMMNSSEYMRTKHMENEYKSELVALIDRCVYAIHALSKSYRRLSKSAGYNMYDGITIDELRTAIGAFSVYESRCTPIRMMKVGGYLERYIDSVKAC